MGWLRYLDRPHRPVIKWYLLTVVVEESQLLVNQETFPLYLHIRHPRVASTNTPNVQSVNKKLLTKISLLRFFAHRAP